jgi:hypothetical protein
VELRIFPQISEIPEVEWDALIDRTDQPFVRWAWLEALERSGCAAPETGWSPCHLGVVRGRQLVAAAPAYLREDSDGDFSRDWGWASGAARAKVPYYPKLTITVPFTPVTGQRVLVAPGEDRAELTAMLVAGARELAQRVGASCVQVLFPTEDEARALEAIGLTRRIDFQFHWRNAGYADYDAFLARFSSKRRHQVRRERAAAATQGISVRTVRGEELAAQRATWGRLAHDFHRNTVDKLMWGRRWLNRAFYDRIFERMPEALEVVVAERDGRPIAGAFNVASRRRLFGRYWGCFEEHPFLHFHVCLYHSIDDCIRRGLEAFEGGAGGEHKIARGFEPSETFSAYLFLDARLARPVMQYIEQEAVHREEALARWRAESPIFRRPAQTTGN